MVILLVFLLIFVCRVVFEIPVYAIVLFFIGLIILISAVSMLVVNAQKKIANNIVRAKLIEEIAVYKKKREYTGFSVSFQERRDHYTYIDVLDYYDCVFSVTYKDGKISRVRCKKGSTLYGELIKKDSK